MKNNKDLCLIYNFAQHYRARIFQLISQTYDCDFVFGDSHGDIKLMDYSLLKGDVKVCHTVRLFGGFYYQKGVLSSLWKGYSSYILLGESRAVSTWLFLLLSKFFSQKKVFLWTHGWYGKETKIESLLKNMMFRLPNGGNFLYGNYARELMLKEGFKAEKLFVIHNSLDYDNQLEIRKTLQLSDIYKNHFNNSNPVVIFIGRLSTVKQLDVLIDAIYMLMQQGVNYNVVFVGDGEEKQRLEQKVHGLQLERCVWFYGACYDELQNATLIYNADVCVAPGNVGLTAMHAMMFGTPVITHNDFSHQMPEFEAVKPGETGDFFNYGDVKSLCGTLQNWIKKNAGTRQKIRENCYREIDESWNPLYQISVLKKRLK